MFFKQLFGIWNPENALSCELQLDKLSGSGDDVVDNPLNVCCVDIAFLAFQHRTGVRRHKNDNFVRVDVAGGVFEGEVDGVAGWDWWQRWQRRQGGVCHGTIGTVKLN